MPFSLPPPLNKLPSFYIGFTQKSNQVRSSISLIKTARDECSNLFSDISNTCDFVSQTIRRTIALLDKSIALTKDLGGNFFAQPVVFSLKAYHFIRTGAILGLLCTVLISAIIFLASSFTALYIFFILCVNALHFLVCILVFSSILASIFGCLTTGLYHTFNEISK